MDFTRLFSLVAISTWTLAPTCFAKTDLELGIVPLSYSKTNNKTDANSYESTEKNAALVTVDPNISIDAIGEKVWLGVNFSAGKDATAGAVTGSYEVSPTIYAGLALSIDSKTDDSTTKFDVGAESQDKRDSAFIGIGPTMSFRQKNNKSITQGYGILLNIKQTEKTESDDTAVGDSDSTFKINLLIVGFDYFYEVMDRLYIGAGLAAQKSFSGKIDAKSGDNKTNGDYEISKFTLNLVQLRIAI